MNKLKFFKISSAVLLVVNLLLLGFIMSGSKSKQRPGPEKMIIKRLQLDEGQQKEYRNLVSNHRVEIKNKEEEIKTLKQNLYQSLSSTSSDKDNQAADMERLGKIQMEIEHVHLSHFEGIKAICKPEQIPAFDELTKEMTRFFRGHKMKRKYEKK